MLYNNQPLELVMTMVQIRITDGEPVWFGFEVSKRFTSKQGFEDLAMLMTLNQYSMLTFIKKLNEV